MSTPSRVFAARLAGTGVFDPNRDRVGRVHDVVVVSRTTGALRAVGLVVEVAGKRRVFVPLSRVTSMDAGAVITTGLLNMRRFEQRAGEIQVVGQLLDRTLTLHERDGGGDARLEDLAIELRRGRDWDVTKLFVRRTVAGGLRWRRGESLLVDADSVAGLTVERPGQGAATLLATLEGLKPADVADVLHDLPEGRRLEVAVELDDERLADVLEELSDEDSVAILTALDTDRAARVLDVMQPDDAADLVGELPADTAAELLERMEPEEADDVRRLLAYGEHTAGGLMTTEPVILGPEATIASALAHVRRRDLAPALSTLVFVVRPPLETPTGRFLGVVHLQAMLREPPHDALGTILDKDIEWVLPTDPLGKVTRLLATYNLTALPVLDEQHRLLGAVSADDVLDRLLPDDWRDADDALTDASLTPGGGRG
ncbi:magnesium transporter [Serinibacter arcticus]|uniref:Magnesium transporter n=1 Tax=Serinibacter arcticus TaxID=1655435 RepID=A0A2U1ZTM5_9MICO|nr:CBS domain-containing protein [Serinibacter arcticus]PWD50326.1 magnesium transporter [Serinibacter arcticus]